MMLVNQLFVLIDEFGSGSDPSLGAELAGVFKEIVNSEFAYGSDYYTLWKYLKVLADQTKFAPKNACMLFDEKI